MHILRTTGARLSGFNIFIEIYAATSLTSHNTVCQRNGTGNFCIREHKSVRRAAGATEKSGPDIAATFE
jgi:hypothetical protein